MARAFLSNPAARPNGPGNVRPSVRTSPPAGAAASRAITPLSSGTRPTRRISPNASSCARSGFMRRKTRLNRRRYTRYNLLVGDGPGGTVAAPRAGVPEPREAEEGQHQRHVAVALAVRGPHRRGGEVSRIEHRDRPDDEDTDELDEHRRPRDRPPAAAPLRARDRREA